MKGKNSLIVLCRNSRQSPDHAGSKENSEEEAAGWGTSSCETFARDRANVMGFSRPRAVPLSHVQKTRGRQVMEVAAAVTSHQARRFSWL
jgi:hypothetical protein